MCASRNYDLLLRTYKIFEIYPNIICPFSKYLLLTFVILTMKITCYMCLKNIYLCKINMLAHSP